MAKDVSLGYKNAKEASKTFDNVFAVDLTGIFLLFFSDNISSKKTEHYIIIDDVV